MNQQHPDMDSVSLRMAEAIALAEQIVKLMPCDEAYMMDIVLSLGAQTQVLEINPLVPRADAALL